MSTGWRRRSGAARGADAEGLTRVAIGSRIELSIERLMEGCAMLTDLTVVLVNKPGSDAAAMQALGSAGINIDGITGSGCGGEGILHILVSDGAAARQALESAGQRVQAVTDVLVCPVEDRPGAGGAMMRRIADA